ncbi:mycothiol transferase [Microlunatus soli]|uniref:DinB superfamily protein n=1 Tax=Microlunatus soli TaxID=630515 RepID=A0A1H1PXV0_9ACTN|nr:DUF664 domain-containing protein [Microlunatus soli]SDS16201.1 Protein of unknown function [Microlunatus soli]
MYAPVVDQEIATLVGYADQQLDAIRAAALGLTEEQAVATPCRSVLSVAGIIKHVVYGLRGTVRALTTGEAGPGELDAAAFAAYTASFALGEGETTTALLAEFDELRPQFLAAMKAADPDADALAPPAPWAGITEPRPIKLRYNLVHQIEELARHAGHIDIIREELDGMSVPALVLTRAGAPANQFFQPYVARPGTIDS